jgi:hypothetical protein
MMRSVVGTFLGLALATTVGPPAALSAQDEAFVFSGVWVGEFEDKTKLERDIATTGARVRSIAGEGESECEGSMTLTFRGANGNLTGDGEVVQTCKGARAGTWQVPSETLAMSEFEFKDKGEGKDKELKFRFEIRARVSPNPSADANDATAEALVPGGSELIRCEAKGKYKPKDMAFKGDYRCRHEFRQRSSGQRNMAIQIRGKFEITRGGAEAGS